MTRQELIQIILVSILFGALFIVAMGILGYIVYYPLEDVEYERVSPNYLDRMIERREDIPEPSFSPISALPKKATPTPYKTPTPYPNTQHQQIRNVSPHFSP